MPLWRQVSVLALLVISSALAFSCSGSTRDESCPYAQWDCNAGQPHCQVKVYDTPSASGCVCNRSRPTSADSCKAGEAFVCIAGIPTSSAQVPGTWDGYLNLDCQCSPWANPTTDNCSGACSYTFLGMSSNSYQCSLEVDSCAGGACPNGLIGCNCAASGPPPPPAP
jgi:hypothetical protein